MDLWHGYSLFLLGDYSGTIEVYQKLLEADPDDPVLYLYIALCLYYNRGFEEARKAAEKGPSCDYR